MDRESVFTTLVRGHRVASGGGGDPRFPGGTIRMQIPHFLERGLDLTSFHPATLNLSLTPFGYRIHRPRHTFREVAWHPVEPAEDFSFMDCEVRPAGGTEWCSGWIYFPHPETKPEHFQPEDMLEVILPRKLPGLAYGAVIELRADPGQIEWIDRGES